MNHIEWLAYSASLMGSHTGEKVGKRRAAHIMANWDDEDVNAHPDREVSKAAIIKAMKHR